MERGSLNMFSAIYAIVLLLMTSLMVTTVAESVDGQYAFVTHASNAPIRAEFDYIIVGGGAAGCPLAATLSQKYRVLVLERGGAPFENQNVMTSSGFSSVLSDVNDTTVSPAQVFESEDGVMNRRARVLGGGTGINAGFYSRAEPDWINKRNLNWARVNESYEWVESELVSFPSLGTWQTAVKDGLIEIGVSPDNGYTYNHAIGVKVGGTIFDSTGHRRTAADLLQYANADNITVYTYGTVHRLLFALPSDSRKPRATGVIYTDEIGGLHEAHLSSTTGSELIVSAGAVGTPQLLMLSGIGPADHLRDFNIPLVLNQPAVGTGLSDNPCLTMLIPSRTPLEASLISTVGVLSTTEFYIEAISGRLVTFNEVQNLNTLDPDYRDDDTVRNFSTMPSRFPQQAMNDLSQSGILMGKLSSPISSGFLRLNSSDVRKNPIVQFNYLSEAQDLFTCVEGVRVMLQVLKTSPFENITYESLPESVLTWASYIAPLVPKTTEGALLAQWCRSTVHSLWHFHGGAREGVVVDDSYKVLGVDALRVIDGSTFNSSPGTNPQATVLMLGRYMGLEILDERDQN